MTASLKKAETAEIYAGFGAEPAPTTPAEFGAFINQEIQRWSRVVKAANLPPQ